MGVNEWNFMLASFPHNLERKKKEDALLLLLEIFFGEQGRSYCKQNFLDGIYVFYSFYVHVNLLDVALQIKVFIVG